MDDGSLKPESLTRVLTPHKEYSTNPITGQRHPYMETESDLKLALVRTYTKPDGTETSERRDVTQIELQEFMDIHLTEIETRGVLNHEGRLIPMDKMLDLLHQIQHMFYTTPITGSSHG